MVDFWKLTGNMNQPTMTSNLGSESKRIVLELRKEVLLSMRWALTKAMTSHEPDRTKYMNLVKELGKASAHVKNIS